MEYRIGTRGSKLALTQAEYVCGRLTEAFPEDTFEIQVIKTKGDVIFLILVSTFPRMPTTRRSGLRRFS